MASNEDVSKCTCRDGLYTNLSQKFTWWRRLSRLLDSAMTKCLSCRCNRSSDINRHTFNSNHEHVSIFRVVVQCTWRCIVISADTDRDAAERLHEAAGARQSVALSAQNASVDEEHAARVERLLEAALQQRVTTVELVVVSRLWRTQQAIVATSLTHQSWVGPILETVLTWNVVTRVGLDHRQVIFVCNKRHLQHNTRRAKRKTMMTTLTGLLAVCSKAATTLAVP